MGELVIDAEITLGQISHYRPDHATALQHREALMSTMRVVLQRHRRHPTENGICCACGLGYPCPDRKLISSTLARELIDVETEKLNQ